MPLRMTTRNAGRATVASRGGRTGGRTGRGGGRTRGRSGNQGNGRIDGQDGQVGGQGNEVNDGIEGFLDFSTIIAQQLQNLLLTIVAQRAVQKAGTLIDEAVRNRSVKKNPEKRGNSRESSRDRNVIDENKSTRTGNAFATTTNPVRREYNGTTLKCVKCNLHHPYEIPCRACFNCDHLGHIAKDCIVAPRMVTPVNTRNPTSAPGACYECGGTDHFKAACPTLNQAQNPGETVQTKLLLIMGDRVVGTMVTRHMKGRKDPSDLGFSYEIEIVSGQLVKIDKVSRSCKLEIEGHMFDINLIPFGSKSFDVIIGMDWLSNHKAKINSYEKYSKDTGFELTAFSDSDHTGCLDSCKSTSSGIQFLSGDKLVSWSSKKQDYTSMSSAEAECVSLSACCT
nr:hypothetical protein [Tanacetum cinerariifolium]